MRGNSQTRVTRTVVVALAAVIVVGCGEDAPVLDVGHSLRILFESSQDGDFEIYSMAPDGSDQQALTQNDAQDVDPAWSNDRSRIAFASDRLQSAPATDIWIMNWDGSDPWQLTHVANARQPAWSPDDSLIVFVSGSDLDAELILLEVENMQRQVLTSNSALDVDPTWAPDGKIIFRSDRDGDGEIFEMSADGSDVRQLTHNDSVDEQPTVARDGTRIYYVGRYDGRPEIFVMNRDGSDAMRLTDSGGQRPCAGKQSDTIVFLRPTGDSAEIAIMTLDGTTQRTLTNNATWEQGVAW